MRMKRRVKRLKQNTLLRVSIVCLLFALFIKALSASGVEEKLRVALFHFAQNPNLTQIALKSETNSFLTQTDESKTQRWVDVLRAQSPVLATIDDQYESNIVASVENNLIPWKMIPPATENPKTTQPQKSLPIKPVSINPTSPNGYVNLGKIYLKNDSTQIIDLNSYLKAQMPFCLKGSGPHVLIVHTHGSESYFPEGRDTYTPTDVERTCDKNFNVIRVGDEVEKILKGKGISVIHDRNIYDSPSYNGSYTRTLAAITAQMKKTPSIKVIIDIHRDSMTTKSGIKYKTSATVNGKPSSQIMLVMSTGESGLPHPNWKENLKFAVKLQCQIANKYPGLMRPIHLRKERFNMHVTTGSMLIEVGTSANSLQEALTAVHPFSEELALLIKSAKK